MAADRSTAELERFLAERADHLLRTEWSYGDQWRSVTYSSPGHPRYDEGYTASAGSSAYTLVNYSTRTWTRQSGGCRALACPPVRCPRLWPGPCGPRFSAEP